MTTRFAVRTTSTFDRALRKLVKRHPDLVDFYTEVVGILETDPYNRSSTHSIKKLVDVSAGDGQYRIRAGRFRFRYDFEGQTVYLKYCSLRNEDTYR
jgi:mRNA-degrading endonuclease RelE of RelBE toxin-antitoxin system